MEKLLKRILSFLPFFYPCIAFPQPEAALHKIIGGAGFEEAREAIPLPGGGYAVTGTTSSTPGGDTDFFLMKLDADMNCIWTHRYGGNGVDNARALAIDSDGNFLLCGFTNTSQQNVYNVLIVKTDSDGDVLWSLDYGGQDWDFGNDISVDSDGKIFVCGYTFSDTAGGSDGFLLKIHPDGQILQSEKFGYSGNDTFNSVITRNDTIFVAGATDHFSDTESTEAWLIGIDSNFQTFTEFHLSGGESEFYGLKPGMQGMMACGYHKTGEYQDALVVTSDFNGSAQTLVDGESINTDYPIRDICFWSDGFMIGGSQNAYGGGENDIMLQQRTLAGQWVIGHTFGQSGNDEIYSINITEDHQAIVAGVTYSYSETAGAQAYIIHLTNVILGNYTNTYSEESCIDFTNDISDINPSSHSIIIRDGFLTYTSDNFNNAVVSIYDISGKKCLERTITPGVSVDLSDLPSGLYIVYLPLPTGTEIVRFQTIR
ncbi:MAG: T9SS type A sorting domain-containing protein [Crocinitomicaceae bacterium]|nr:T9SS type A sorting domain-containing protein [Crocinitomicaceae bacterium]